MKSIRRIHISGYAVLIPVLKILSTGQRSNTLYSFNEYVVETILTMMFKVQKIIWVTSMSRSIRRSDEKFDLDANASLETIAVNSVSKALRYFAFGRNLEEIHMTWAHLEKKRTRLRTYTNMAQEFLYNGWRRRHNYNSIFSSCYLFRNLFSSTTIGDENPIRTLGDYSKPSDEGYRNTIKLPAGNNVVPFQSDTIRLVQNGCSFHGLRSEDPNQHLKDFLKLVDSLDLDGENRERTHLRFFQFFLRDQASNWLERLPAGSITT
ncbi:hypothetical protein Tco_0793405 [Tanacetum coccineum]